MSQAPGATCAVVCPGPKPSSPPGPNIRVTARCGISTPLGTPVLPEVKNTVARSSGAVRTGANGSAASPAASAASGPGASVLVTPSGSPPGRPTTTGPSSWARIAARRLAGQRGSRVAYAAPLISTPSWSAISWAPRGSSSGTMSPGRTPQPVSRPARARAAETRVR